ATAPTARMDACSITTSPGRTPKARKSAERRSRECMEDCASVLGSVVPNKPTDPRSVHTRRKRYSGKNPRAFHDKYKEHNPERYAADAEKILASGKTLAGTHRPVMVEEVLTVLRPNPGDVVVDCTLGGGGHALRLAEHVQPGGRVIGIDVDAVELARTEAHLRTAGL